MRLDALLRRRAHLAAGLLVTAAIAGAAVVHTTPARAATSASPAVARISGLTPTPTHSLSTFGSWRGAPVQALNYFMPNDTWAVMKNPGGGGPDSYKGLGVQMVWSVPMFPQDGEGANLKSGAAGAYNDVWLGMARKLVADGQGNADLRIGWEMNGSWFSWSGLKDPTSWIGYWRQIVTTMRSVPGQSFTFDWSPANGSYKFDTGTLYPGDSYVSEVGQSVYDQSWSYPSSDYTDRWHSIDTGSADIQGLEWLASFATAHSKPMEFVEWGLSSRPDGHGGGDDPYFIQHFHDFLATHWVRLETYFEPDDGGNTYAVDSGKFPNAAALYKQLWSADQVSPTAPIIDVSYQSGRFSPVALSKQAIKASGFYAFVANAPAGTTNVRYWIDKVTSTAMHTESYAPWDLEGGSDTTANAFHTSSLSAGTHVLYAMLSGSYGSQTVKSTFTVG